MHNRVPRCVARAIAWVMFGLAALNAPVFAQGPTAQEPIAQEPSVQEPSVQDPVPAEPASEAPTRYRIIVDGPEPRASTVRMSISLARREGEPTATRERLQRLLRSVPDEVAEILASDGYFSPRVRVELRDREAPWTVEIAIETGEPTRVSAVELVFVGAITDATTNAGGGEPSVNSARAAWSLPVGEIFRQSAWEDAKRAVLRHLLARRFAAARIATSLADVDPETRSARLRVEVASGPEYRFGSLQIRGLARYAPRVVENLNLIRPGTVYAQAALADLQTRIQSNPYFSSVSVTVDPAGTDPAALPIRVEVTEAQRHRVELGGGYSSDTGLRAQATYTDVDFLGRGLRWRNQLRLDQKQQSASTQLAWPARADGYQDDIGLSWTHTDVSGLSVHSVSFTGKRAKNDGRIERAITFLAAFNVEKTAGGTGTYKQALMPGYSWRVRALDNLIDPRRGWDLGLQLGFGAKPLGSDQNFGRAAGRLVVLFPVSAWDSVILRAEGGVVLAPSRQGLPEQLLFRAGGDQSLRGYAYQSIGVRENDATVGGRYMALLGAEYIRWVGPKWGVAVFYERGDAFDDRLKFDWKSGYGLGARFRTPVGPINVDLAYGEAVHNLRLHLSLGFYF